MLNMDSLCGARSLPYSFDTNNPERNETCTLDAEKEIEALNTLIIVDSISFITEKKVEAPNAWTNTANDSSHPIN